MYFRIRRKDFINLSYYFNFYHTLFTTPYKIYLMFRKYLAIKFNSNFERVIIEDKIENLN